MRSSRRSSDTLRAVPVMRFSGASTCPAIAQPTAPAISTTPTNAMQYWNATSSSASLASGAGSVRSKWRPSSQ